MLQQMMISFIYFSQYCTKRQKLTADISSPKNKYNQNSQKEQTSTMSVKPKIKFHYGKGQDEDFKSVGSVHKGPINLSNLYDTLTNPTYDQIKLDNVEGPKNVEIVQSQAGVVNVPSAQHITHAVDKMQITPRKDEPSINLQSGKDVIDTEAYKKIHSEKEVISAYQIRSSEMISPEQRESAKRQAIFKKKSQEDTPQPELKIQELRQSQFRNEVNNSKEEQRDGVDLRYTGRSEAEMLKNEKEKWQNNTDAHVQDLRETTKKNSQKELQETIRESQNPNQVVLKSPSFKYNPENENDKGVLKKQYVRAEKAEKYLYSGIPEKKEDDFMGCFGCCTPKPKTYKIANQNEQQYQ